MRNIISKLCNISEKSYYVWKNKSHTTLIELLERYFTKDELDEWINTGKIEKFELIRKIKLEDLKKIVYNNSIKSEEPNIVDINVKLNQFQNISLLVFLSLFEHKKNISQNGYEYIAKSEYLKEAEAIKNVLIEIADTLNISSSINIDKIEEYLKIFDRDKNLFLAPIDLGYILVNKNRFISTIKEMLFVKFGI
jgi:hypothetical protein